MVQKVNVCVVALRLVNDASNSSCALNCIPTCRNQVHLGPVERRGWSLVLHYRLLRVSESTSVFIERVELADVDDLSVAFASVLLLVKHEWVTGAVR